MTQEKRPHPHKNLSLSRRTDGGKGDKHRIVDQDKYNETLDKVFDKKPWYEDRDMSWLDDEDTTKEK